MTTRNPLFDHLDLETTITTMEGASHLAVRGVIDAATAPWLRRVIAGITLEADTNLTLNLSKVTFIDVAGLSAVVLAVRRARTNDASLVIVDPSPQVSRLLDISGFDTLIPIAWMGQKTPEPVLGHSVA
jgi:anti-anti-sigma factor